MQKLSYEKLVKIYNSEAGEDATKIREILVKIRKKLYDLYSVPLRISPH